jgi:hypothetical protein
MMGRDHIGLLREMAMGEGDCNTYTAISDACACTREAFEYAKGMVWMKGRYNCGAGPPRLSFEQTKQEHGVDFEYEVSSDTESLLVTMRHNMYCGIRAGRLFLVCR